MVNRLPRDLLDNVSLIALLGPGEMVSFEFHPAYWLSDFALTSRLSKSLSKNELPVLPEIKKLEGKKIICFCGDRETDSLCEKMDTSFVKVVILNGGHHFDGDYEAIAKKILQESHI